MDLFTLVARLGMDSSDYEKGIAKAKGSFSELGNSISAKAVAMGNMITGAINKAVDIASDLGRSAIQNAADVAAEKAQFKATFDTLQGEAERAFKEIEKSTGVFGTRLQNVGTKAFSQFKGAGLDGVQALDMMKSYTELAADAAAYYDISLEDADARLRSFLRGNTEAGDAIGLFTSESQRNSAAMEKYGQKWTKLTEAQKQMLMLDISRDIYEQSGAIGQAARESDSWTNVVGNLKEAWRQATALIGAPIMSALTPVIQDITNFLKDENTQTLLTRFGLTIVNIAKQSFQNVKTFIDDVSGWLDDYEIPITTIIGALIGLWAVANPFGAILAALVLLITNWEGVKKWTEESLEKFEEYIKTKVPEGFLSGAIEAWNTILGMIQAAQEAADAFIKSLSGANAAAGAAAIQAGAKTGGISGALSAAWDNAWYNPKNWGTGYESTHGGYGAKGFATGLDYVPHDDFYARLHEGEAVLTKTEATQWRKGDGYARSDAELLSEIRALRQDLTSRREVMTPDGRVIGEISYETVSQMIADGAYSRRYG